MQVIIEQGEGSRHSPLDMDKDLAHYYRLAEIYHGRRLVSDSSDPTQFSFTGAVVEVDEDDVIDLTPNQRLDSLERSSEQYQLASQFASRYSLLLDSLHECFNGAPDLQPAIDCMFDMKQTGDQLIHLKDRQSGRGMGLPFVYLPPTQRTT